MIQTKGYAAYSSGAPLKSFEFKRRDVLPKDVAIDVLFCGVCHSDLHSVNGDWGGEHFPLVPGHEIVGVVTAVGPEVKHFKVGQNVGVGCLVDSCRTCAECKEGYEQFCEKGMVGTYGSPDKNLGGVTQGGYSTKIVVDEAFVLRIPDGIPLDRAAPLLCAGITTYSPLKHWKIGKGSRVAVAGLGGLGHMGVKLAASFGAHVSVLSTSEKKRADAMNLGAHDFVVTKDPVAFAKAQGSFDLILDTISAPHSYDQYLRLLKRDGTMVLLGLPDPQSISAGSLIRGRKSLAGSLIGGIEETQEMLDYCAKHEIVCDIETIKMSQINEAYERMVRGDVHYRFVIDLASLKN
jgi:uncharacterized zinc-type alcohol dehydrogenase-like protein